MLPPNPARTPGIHPRHDPLHPRHPAQVEGQWYEVQDLRVTEVLPQMVALSETYLQVYELQQGQGTAAAMDTK